jgi:hypothetical protein
MEENLMADKLFWQKSLNEARANVPFSPFTHNHSGYAAGKPPAALTKTPKR